MQESFSKRGLELNAARLRMATLPSPAEVLFTEGSWVPLVCVNGIYVLPGIPKLFQSMIMGQQVGLNGTREYMFYVCFVRTPHTDQCICALGALG